MMHRGTLCLTAWRYNNNYSLAWSSTWALRAISMQYNENYVICYEPAFWMIDSLFILWARSKKVLKYPYNPMVYLLRREIPMAWGTTTDSLTPEINPFQYAKEIKCLTLKDQTLYLIPDGWSRSPLSFPIFSLNCYSTSLTTSKQYKHTIFHGVRSILAYIINNV